MPVCRRRRSRPPSWPCEFDSRHPLRSVSPRQLDFLTEQSELHPLRSQTEVGEIRLPDGQPCLVPDRAGEQFVINVVRVGNPVHRDVYTGSLGLFGESQYSTRRNQTIIVGLDNQRRRGLTMTGTLSRRLLPGGRAPRWEHRGTVQ